jgi:hypothetical protein
MKKQFVLLSAVNIFFGIFCITGSSQIRQLPEVVRESFQNQYPSATNVAYTDKLVEVDVSFVDSGYTCRARYTSKGEWENTDKQIRMEQLPESVNDGYNKSKYAADWKIDEIYEVDIPDNIKEYKLVVERGTITHKNLYFSLEGRLLSDNLSL